MGVLYTATSPALALLETLVHFPRVIYDQLPRLRVFSLRIPDGEVRWVYPDLLPDEWADATALPLTQSIFSEWLQSPTDLGLGVPSAVMDIPITSCCIPSILITRIVLSWVGQISFWIDACGKLNNGLLESSSTPEKRIMVCKVFIASIQRPFHAFMRGDETQ